EFFSPSFGFSRRLLRRRQFAAEFPALLLQIAQLLFQSLAPLGFFPRGCLGLRSGRFHRFELSAQSRFQTSPFRPDSLGSAGALAQPLPQFFASPLGFSRRLLHRRQLAAEFLALFLQSAQLLFKSLAPPGFFLTGCLRLRCRRFRRLQLSAQFRFQAHPFRPGSLGSAGALAQPFLQFFASPLGFSRRLLRRGQPAAEFLALFLQTAPFLFKLLAPPACFPSTSLFRSPPSLPPLSPPSVVRPTQIPGAPVPSWLARFRRCSRAAVSPVLRFAAWILPLLAAPSPACR